MIGTAVLAAYHGTFRAPFVLDDITAIPENPSIRALWPLWRTFSPPPSATTMGGRPLANLTMAVNYALSGADPWSYHAVNILIHIMAAMALFGVVRRTLLLPILRDRFGRDSFPLALAVSLTWALHPLQTESVTYVVQRVESLAGLLYLSCLYCFIRSAGSQRPLGWQVATVAACLAGMGTKEVMVTAPAMLLLYDRTFLAGTFLGAWRKRRSLYLTLSLTWVFLILLLAGTGWNRGGSAGFGSVSAWSYWVTQFEALALYMKLSLWPHPLVFDYGTRLLARFSDAVPYALVVVPFMAATLVALRLRPILGFLGASYFLLLAPSSVVPVATQTIAEHRLYLSLAAVAAAFVVGAYALLGRRCWLPVSAGILVLGCLSSERNEVYSSPISLWGDTAAMRPGNSRAHNNLARALFAAGRDEEAITQYRISLGIEAGDPGIHSNLGNALDRTGRTREAIEEYQAALRIQPDFAPAIFNLANALNREGRTAEAIAAYETVVRIQPDYAQAHFNLANALAQSGQIPESIGHYEEALRIQPDLVEANSNLGMILCRSGRIPEGLAHIDAALRTSPEYAPAHFLRGLALLQTGRAEEAAGEFRRVLDLRPNDPSALKMLDSIRNSR